MAKSSVEHNEHELESAQRHVEATERLIRLIAELETYIDQPIPDKFPGNADRARLIALQVAVGRFFGSLGCQEIAFQFFGFSGALHDLDSGIVHEALKSNPKGGRSPDPYQKWFVRAGVAAAAECFLIAHNQQKKRATRQLDERKTEYRALLRNQEDQLEDAPFNWLRQFKKADFSTPVILPVWEVYAKLIERFKGRDPSNADWIDLGNSFLDIACRQAARLSWRQ
jgi:hypothetical protein